MTDSRLVYTVELVGTQHVVSPTAGSLTLDELYTPFVAGNLRIALPTDPAVLDALDPRKGARVRVSISQQFGAAFALADVTAGSGSSAAAWTADLAGRPLSTWTDRYGSPYNAEPRPSRSRRFNLGVRDMVADHNLGTLDLRVESDEALLLDYALVQETPAQPVGNTVRGAVQLVLGRIGAVLGAGTDDGPIEAEAAPWMPGQRAWDYVKPLIDTAALRLYCDERRVWHLVQPLAPTRGSLAFSGDNATLVQDQVVRDADWYDAVVIVYRWTDSGGINRVRYDTAAVEGFTRAMTLEYENRPYPGPGAAAAILSRARGRGRVEAVTAVLNPDATPGQAMTVSLPGIPTQTGMSTHVTFDMSSDVMQVRSRDLTDTPPNAWVLAPYGLTWNDVPPGTSWDDFDLTEVGT